MAPSLIRFSTAYVLVACICLSSRTAGAEPVTELLWPRGAPGAKGDKPADKPTLSVCLPPDAAANGAAVVICPGGGYGNLATDHEGRQIARWLNSITLSAHLDVISFEFPGPVALKDLSAAAIKGAVAQFDFLFSHDYRLHCMARQCPLCFRRRGKNTYLTSP